MKRFTAALLAVLFLFACGCKKSAAEYISDMGDFFETRFFSLILDDEINVNHTVIIEPDNITSYDRQLSAYNKLTKNQKHLYSIMEKAAENMELRLINVTKYSSVNLYSEAIAAQMALLSDRPDMFWMPKAVSVLSVDGKDKRYICFKDYNDEDDNIGYYGMTKAKKEQMQSELNNAVNDILNELNGVSSLFDRELIIHDYLCKNIVYDDEAANNLDSADSNIMTVYGALVGGKAICEGYSKAFQYLCLKSGIDCSVVYGDYDRSPHMWNILSLGGELYYADVTFDDSSDLKVLHKYFNITKAQALEKHIFYEEFSGDKNYSDTDDFNFFCDDCDNITFNYFEQKGAYIKTDCKKALKAVMTAKQNGETELELENRTPLSDDEAVNLLVSKLRRIVNIQKYYTCDENIIIVTW